MSARNIGIGVAQPKSECNDEKCPFHGTLPVRGTTLRGKVVSAKGGKTATIKREYLYFLPKYERYERRHSKISVYNPECIAAKEGDDVVIVECRPLSKTKHFVIVEKVNG
ncbi:MAG: 30S ribosomal protein S17 [Candidatus Aenigmarchaeota archaeon]|nr:30S ribosomal protein S17 [Candidatus Aenigmarchaeota archaeon]